MLKWIEATGKSEELAVKNALAELGLDRDSVSVEVLERAKNGFFGIGAAPAKVKVTYEVPDETDGPEEFSVDALFAQPLSEEPKPEPKPEPKAQETRPAPKAEPAPKPEPAPQAAPAAEPEPAPRAEEKPAPKAESKVPVAELEPAIRAFLSGLLEHMGVEASINVAPKGDNGVMVTLEGPKLGAIIGHRGETLDAVQQLTNYAVNRGRPHRVRIHIDAENYRAKREDSLRRLASKVAGKVTKYRRNITLEPMNAYERHVIHETLQDYPDVITYSTGTEPNRRTVVAYSRGKHAY